MINFLGNCGNIDWDSVIADCINHEPEFIGPSHSKGDNLPGLDEVANLWEHAGYKNLDQGGTVGWGMYLPGKQFEQSVIDEFCKMFQIEDLDSAWSVKLNQETLLLYIGT